MKEALEFSIDSKKIVVEPSAKQPNHWMLTDKKHSIVCIFKRVLEQDNSDI